MPNELASASMWFEASADVEAEQHRNQLVAAKVALAGAWPFLAAAVDSEDFGNRLALMREQIESTTPPEVLGDVVASFRSDWQVLDEERKSALNVTASASVATPTSYTHLQDKGEYWQVDRVHSSTHVETITRTASREDAYLHVDKTVPIFENGRYVTGGRLHHVASAEEFYDQGRGKWVRLAGRFHVVEGRGEAEFPEDPSNYEDGIRDAYLHNNQGYDYSQHPDFGAQSHGYQNGYSRAKDEIFNQFKDETKPSAAPSGRARQGAFTPDPTDGWRYSHYPPTPPLSGDGGSPAGPPDAAIGPDGFPIDLGVGEQRTPEAYARQTTPGPWTVTPGTEWRDSYLPNAATGLAPGQSPSGNPAQASRRTASAWDPADTHVPGHRPFPYNYTDSENEAYDIGVDRAGQGEPLVNIHGVPGTGIEAFSPEHHMYTRGWQGERREHARPHPDMERRDFTPITSTRRTAGSESGTSDDFNGSDKPYWKCSLCGENNYSHGDKCNGCGKATKSKVVDWLDERTGKRASRHTAEYAPAPEQAQRAARGLFGDRQNTVIHPDKPDHYLHGVGGWYPPAEIKDEGNGDFSHVNPLSGEVARFNEHGSYNRNGELVPHNDVEDRYRSFASRHTAQEGIAPSGPGPNPYYFSQGTNGLAGPPTFPEDPGPEPYTNTLINDFYGTVPPQESTGSEQGTQDGQGYSRMSRRSPDFNRGAGERTSATSIPGLGCPNCDDGFYTEDERTHHIRVQHPGEYSGPTADLAFAKERLKESRSARTAASGLEPADDEEDPVPDPDDPYAAGRANRRHDLGRMAALSDFRCQHCGTPLSEKGLCHVEGCPWAVPEGYEETGEESDYGPWARHSARTAATNGQIVGHCDSCGKPVRWHDGKDSHLEHLHNSSHKCNDGTDARTSSLQFFDPTWVATVSRTASNPLAIAPAGGPPMPPTNAPITGTTPPTSMPTPTPPTEPESPSPVQPAQPAQAAQPMQPTQATGSNRHQRPAPGISSVSSTFAAYPPHFQTTSLQTITAPTAENPTGRSTDEYKANTWEGLINQRPMQSAEDRHVNTPVQPQEHLRTRNINTPTPGLDDQEEDSVRDRGDEDEEED